jgi:dihydrofolate synthase/folylpolyglutamate synthase
VAGTNGKGSVCALVSSALRHAGFRTGLYTSPHLVQPTERIQINGVPVSEAEFANAFETVHAAAERLMAEERIDAHPSYFETVTAMAFIIFRQSCDMSVIEVGLGGRLDATNVIDPELCIITPIGFDHEIYLGNSIEAIAGEKAGILKPDVPVVLSKQVPAAETVITGRARALNCRILRAKDVHPANIQISARGSEFDVDGVHYRCNLPGRHQIENATTAILACRHLGIGSSAIRRGVAEARWPGRLEFVHEHPDFVLDGAHNPAGASALAAYIKEFCVHRPVWLVYGAMRDKAIEEVTALLFPLAHRLVLTAPDFPRALRPEAILAVNSHPNASVTENVAEAVDLARSAPPDAIVFFTGSLFLVGEARALLVGQSHPVS